jgi:hypothetical protein
MTICKLQLNEVLYHYPLAWQTTVLLLNTRLGWKCLPGKNSGLSFVNYSLMKFYNITPGLVDSGFNPEH